MKPLSKRGIYLRAFLITALVLCDAVKDDPHFQQAFPVLFMASLGVAVKVFAVWRAWLDTSNGQLPPDEDDGSPSPNTPANAVPTEQKDKTE